jgi:protein-tyrosine-phosphatase
MGCGDACPIYPGKRYEDWSLNDPSELDLDGVREVRNDISERISNLLKEMKVL